MISMHLWHNIHGELQKIFILFEHTMLHRLCRDDLNLANFASIEN
jgi:hypothetical protein